MSNEDTSKSRKDSVFLLIVQCSKKVVINLKPAGKVSNSLSYEGNKCPRKASLVSEYRIQ